jgi:enoyl-CoA hydratase
MNSDQKTDSIRIDILDGGVAVVTLHNPPANAMDAEILTKFCDCLDSASANSDVRALVVAAEGKAFCAGMDLKAVVDYDRAQQQATVNGLNRMVQTVYGFRTPTVVAITGHAIAGGLILAMSCDARIGPEGVGLYGLAEVKVSIPFPMAAAEVVRAELSPSAVRNAAMFGTNMSAEEAFTSGVFDELQPLDQVQSRAVERARELAELPPNAFLTIKQQVRGPALARMARGIADKSDPALENWITEETRTAALALLGGKK